MRQREHISSSDANTVWFNRVDARAEHRNLLIKFPPARDQLRSCGSFPIPLNRTEEENDVLSVTVSADDGTNVSSISHVVENKYCPFDVSILNS